MSFRELSRIFFARNEYRRKIVSVMWSVFEVWSRYVVVIEWTNKIDPFHGIV